MCPKGFSHGMLDSWENVDFLKCLLYCRKALHGLYGIYVQREVEIQESGV